MSLGKLGLCATSRTRTVPCHYYWVVKLYFNHNLIKMSSFVIPPPPTYAETQSGFLVYFFVLVPGFFSLVYTGRSAYFMISIANILGRSLAIHTGITLFGVASTVSFCFLFRQLVKRTFDTSNIKTMFLLFGAFVNHAAIYFCVVVNTIYPLDPSKEVFGLVKEKGTIADADDVVASLLHLYEASNYFYALGNFIYFMLSMVWIIALFSIIYEWHKLEQKRLSPKTLDG